MDTYAFNDADSKQTPRYGGQESPTRLKKSLKNAPRRSCARDFSPQKEPMIPSELLQYPWQKVGVDLSHLHGANYLVVVDYFSRYPEVQKRQHNHTDGH